MIVENESTTVVYVDIVLNIKNIDSNNFKKGRGGVINLDVYLLNFNQQFSKFSNTLWRMITLNKIFNYYSEKRLENTIQCTRKGFVNRL